MHLIKLGNVPICNRKRDRAPIIKGFCFPLCWRCSMITFGTVLSIAVIVYLKLEQKLINNYGLAYGVILALPMIIDGVLQYGFNIKSNNIRRGVTGLCFGVAVGILSLYLKMVIVNAFN